VNREAGKRGFRVFTDSLETFHPEQLYDVVILSHVLEHSLKPKEMLTHVARILNPDGEVWISCPNIKSWQQDIFGRYWINWHVPFHITFFSAATLKFLLNDSALYADDSRSTILDRIDATGTLEEQLEIVIKFIRRNLRVSYRIDQAEPREEVQEIPEAVFREALLNALTHRDYFADTEHIFVQLKTLPHLRLQAFHQKELSFADGLFPMARHQCKILWEFSTFPRQQPTGALQN